METVQSPPPVAKVPCLRERRGLAVEPKLSEGLRDPHWVEGESLNGVNGIDPIDNLSMTLEGVFLGLNFGCWVEELDGDSSFD